MCRFLRLFHPTPRRFKTRPDPGRAIGPVKFRNHNEWEVEEIQGHRIVNGAHQYRLKWRDHEQPTWANVDQLENCAEMLRDYQSEHGIPLSYWDEAESSPESESGEEDEMDSDDELIISGTHDDGEKEHDEEQLNKLSAAPSSSSSNQDQAESTNDKQLVDPSPQTDSDSPDAIAPLNRSTADQDEEKY